MDIIRIENNVPTVYCNESRDFQLLARLYTAVVNGVKFDIDTIEYLTDTAKCKSSVLALLQSKLGFFTQRTYEDDKLRYVLQAFPVMVKNKGSLKGIQQCIDTFLKVYQIRTNVVVWATQDSTQVYNVTVDDHTIIVGLNEALKGGLTLLYDMLRYVLPTGFGLYIYFYRAISDSIFLIDKNKATLLFVSDDINSNVRTMLSKEWVKYGSGTDRWQDRAISCTNNNLKITIDWDIYQRKVYPTVSDIDFFTFTDAGWVYNNKTTQVNLEDYGIGISSGTPVKGDKIEVAILTDELVGAVDTARAKSVNGDKDLFTFTTSEEE